jgi:RNA polymerase primary sigma factor
MAQCHGERNRLTPREVLNIARAVRKEHTRQLRARSEVNLASWNWVEQQPPVLSSTDSLKAALQTVVGTLPARQRQIVEMRYGLDDWGPGTLRKIARSIRMSTAGVRQTLLAAIKKLGHPARSERLSRYVY